MSVNTGEEREGVQELGDAASPPWTTQQERDEEEAEV